MALDSERLEQLRATRPNVVGHNLVARAIELARVTQIEVAQATRLPQPYVSDVARNRYRTITVENASKFARFFGCSIEDLFPSCEAVAS